MLEHYLSLCRRHGGRLTGSWQLALAIATPAGCCHDRLVTSPRILQAEGTSRRRAGYPLDSLQFDPLTGRYLADMSSDEILAFWQRTIGDEITRFATSTLALLDSDVATTHAHAATPLSATRSRASGILAPAADDRPGVVRALSSMRGLLPVSLAASCREEG